MAVKRTGIVYPVKRPRFKQSPPRLSRWRDALSIFGKILETVGRPFYWLSLVVAYFLLVSPFLIRRTFFWLGKFLFQSLNLLRLSFITFFSRFIHYLIQLTKLFRIRFVFRLPRLSLPHFKQPHFGKKWLITLSLIFLLSSVGYFVYWFILKDLPDPQHLVTRPQIVSTKIYDRRGELLYKIYRKQNRTLVKLEEIPLSLIQATVAIEDAEFYQHYGFSPKAIVRSFFRNLRGGKIYGGSTITQQLVKNTLLSSEKTMQRKIKEVLLALLVEQKFTKDEILQMYFNEVGYGGAAYGVEEATQMYFGKSVQDLNLVEAALLAGLPAAPTTHSPFGAHPEKAKERQRLVLRRMGEEGYLTQEEAERAKKEELRFASQRTDIRAPHFVMYVKELLAERYGLKLVEEGGLEVITSLDLKLQEKTQKTISQEIGKLSHLRVSNGAALITQPQTGEVLAMVGSQDYFDLARDGNVNVTLAARQPGSAIKPVNYSLALENGFTTATVIPDTPITYRLPGQKPYSPRNYDNRFHGNVPLRTALASSYNVPAVKVLSSLGVKKMVERGQAMGITTWDDPSRFGLSLTLGGGEVKMVDMAVVYGTLANLGTRVDLNPILKVKTYGGEILEELEPESKKVLSANIAFLLTDILADNTARTPAFGPNSDLVIPDHPHVAVKTGTTQNLRDNWTIGYTLDYVVAVWVGNNDNTPMSHIASGVTGASPIWQQIMTDLIQEIPDKEFPQPQDLKRVEICPRTNTLPCQGCGGKWEYFLAGTEPKRHCDLEKFKKEKKEREKKKEAV